MTHEPFLLCPSCHGISLVFQRFHDLDTVDTVEIMKVPARRRPHRSAAHLGKNRGCTILPSSMRAYRPCAITVVTSVKPLEHPQNVVIGYLAFASHTKPVKTILRAVKRSRHTSLCAHPSVHPSVIKTMHSSFHHIQSISDT